MRLNFAWRTGAERTAESEVACETNQGMKHREESTDQQRTRNEPQFKSDESRVETKNPKTIGPEDRPR